jgi:hypothetical protein
MAKLFDCNEMHSEHRLASKSAFPNSTTPRPYPFQLHSSSSPKAKKARLNRNVLQLVVPGRFSATAPGPSQPQGDILIEVRKATLVDICKEV